jgi:serine/threonine protein kinase/Tfp pilus assembly protein PilF
MSADLEIGAVIAGHRIERLVGRGGMGVVYLAVDESLERPVALKLIAPDLASDTRFRDRFKREARMLAELDHPNVIRIWRYGEHEGQLFVAMQFIEGTDLAGLIDLEGRLVPYRAARIIANAAAALDVAHGHGLVHRDVKPHNILIEKGVGDERVVLTDFGLAKRTRGSQSRVSQTRGFVGTPAYAAPELVRSHRVDARADVYSLGVVLFEALTGRLPFTGDAAAMLVAHAVESAPLVSDFAEQDVPAAFDNVVGRALAKLPDERFASAGDLGRAALAAADDRSVNMLMGSVARGDAAPRTDASEVESPPPEGSSVAQDPASSQMRELLRRAEGHRVTRRYDSALEEFGRALELSHDSVDALAGRGHTLLSCHRVDDAAADLERALELDATSVYALIGRGGVHMACNRATDALDDYTTALGLDPGSLEAVLGRSAALLRLNRLQDARAAVGTASAIDPAAADTLTVSATLEMHSERPAQALELAGRAVEADDRSPAAYVARGVAYLASGDLPAAVKDLTHAQDLDPLLADAQALLGLVLLRNDHLEDAVAVLNRALELSPTSSRTNAWLVAAYVQQNRTDEAKRACERALELDANCASAVMAQAICMLSEDQPKVGLDMVDRALHLDRGGMLAFYGAGKVYVWRGEAALALRRFNEAEADFSLALAAEPLLVDALAGRARSLAALGRLEDAVSAYRLALLHAPTSAELYLGRGEARLALSQYALGLSDLHRAISLSPDSEALRHARREVVRQLPVDETLGHLFHALGMALDEENWGAADERSIEIVRGAAGHDLIDSREKAEAVDAAVLAKLDAMWRDSDQGQLRRRPWMAGEKAGVTKYKRIVSFQTWLTWRLKQLGL